MPPKADHGLSKSRCSEALARSLSASRWRAHDHTSPGYRQPRLSALACGVVLRSWPSGAWPLARRGTSPLSAWFPSSCCLALADTEAGSQIMWSWSEVSPSSSRINSNPAGDGWPLVVPDWGGFALTIILNTSSGWPMMPLRWDAGSLLLG